MLTNDWPTLDVLRLRYIAKVLEHMGGNKTRAADCLGIDRRTLNRILSRQRARQAAAERFRATAIASRVGFAARFGHPISSTASSLPG